MESDSSRYLYLMLGLVLGVVVYAFLVAVVTALRRTRFSRLNELAEQGKASAQRAKLVFEEEELYQQFAQICMYPLALICGAIGFVLARRFLRLSDQMLFLFDRGDFYLALYYLVALLVIAVPALIIIQAVRMLTTLYAEWTLMFLTPILRMIARVRRPILFVNRITRSFLRRFGIITAQGSRAIASAEDISELIARSSEAGGIEEDERELIEGVFHFSETLVKEVMTPRKDIISVTLEATLDEIIAAFVEHGYSRLLVIGNQLDDVRGILIAKDLIPLIGKPCQEFNITPFIRPVHFVQNTKKIDDVLNDFKSQGTHFAVVLDEHGGVGGVITFEDMIEELVGDIFDEYDHPEDERDIQHTRGGEFLIDGSLTIDDLNDLDLCSVPEGEYDTVAGFVIDRLGRIPENGEVVEYDGVQFKVEEQNDNRVTLLRVIPHRPAEKPKSLTSKEKGKEVSQNKQASGFESDLKDRISNN